MLITGPSFILLFTTYFVRLYTLPTILGLKLSRLVEEGKSAGTVQCDNFIRGA